MKNILRLTYVLESLWNEVAQEKHTTNTQLSTSRKKKPFLEFLLATVLSESNRGMNALDRVFNLYLILAQVTEDGRILPRIFSSGLKR